MTPPRVGSRSRNNNDGGQSSPADNFRGRNRPGGFARKTETLFQPEVEAMRGKIYLALMAGVAALLFGGGIVGAAPPIEQPPKTSYMQSKVGTADELSPIAPAEAKKVCKVGNQWTCEINGQPMVYNEAASRWEPKQK
jgi:hypothetical protein